MRAVLQRVSGASVSVNEKICAKINKGFLIFLGVGQLDTKEIADKMIEKILKLRIFEDENGKTNLSISDVGGEILVVSQFTLYADCKKGNRPSFTNAAAPQMANELYEYVLEGFKTRFKTVESGVFGADMTVSIQNDGPFTLMLDSEQLFQ